MEMICQAINRNLDIVYFFYGMAFMTMGIAISAQPKKNSEFRLTGALRLVAWFGIIHGANEFLDMWSVIDEQHPPILDALRWSCLVVSYLFLFEAGAKCIRISRPLQANTPPEQTRIPAMLIIVVAVASLSSLSSDFLKTASILSRYFLGLPGGLLTGWGLLRYYQHENKILTPIKVKKHFYAGGAAFITYGLLGGLIVPPNSFFPANLINTQTFLQTFGLPVQLFRALCAAGIGWSIVGMLKIYEWEKEQLRKTLTSAIVHDLKNPLTTILGSLTIAQENPDDKDLKTLLHMAVNSCRNMIGLTQILLDVDRMESGVLKPEIARTPIQDLFMSCALEIDMAQSRGVRVTIQDTALLPKISADKGLMQRVFYNLLQNSIKAISDKGEISIQAAYKSKDKTFLFTIHDNGSGIPKEELPYLFKKYYRTHGRTQKGTGLGLYFCRLVVQAHEGTIHVASEVGQGTTITITLPEKPSIASAEAP